MTNAVDNINILSQDVLVTPRDLKQELPLSDAARKTITEGRQVIQNILNHKDHRILVVVGPCSIHDTKAALDYAGIF